MTEMRKKGMALLLSAWMLLTAGCSQGTPAGTSSVPPESSQVASGSEMAGVTDVVEEGMVPVSGDSLKDGTYPITVDSSSSMFRVVRCELTVLDGEMTAEMTMGGTGYLRVFPGTRGSPARPSARRRRSGTTGPCCSGRTPSPRRRGRRTLRLPRTAWAWRMEATGWMWPWRGGPAGPGWSLRQS